MKIEITQHDRKISMELEGEDQDLSEMLCAFEDVLKALGYVFDGYLDIVSYDLPIDDTMKGEE